MIDLIVLACSLANPAQCREYHMLLGSEYSLRTCAMKAEPVLEEWADEHPNLRVARWRCAWPERENEKT